MKKRKWLVALLAVFMAFGSFAFASCGENSGEQGGQEQTGDNTGDNTGENPDDKPDTPSHTSHTFGGIAYVWNEDYSACTAGNKCTGCDAFEDGSSEKGRVYTSVVTYAAKGQDGEKVVVAEFQNPAFEKQTKTVSYASSEEIDRFINTSTVAVHDPSIVVAYEKDGKYTPSYVEGSRKVYFVFGTQASQAYSYDLINWTAFRNNLNDGGQLLKMMPDEMAHAGNSTAEAALGNCWAPDVIWNPVMKKWTMYLSVNGDNYRSSIVLLTADSLRGNWTYVGPVVFSGIKTSGNAAAIADYKKVTGESSVPDKYDLRRYGSVRVYGMNAIDACVKFDGDRLYMSYGSWFGGIFMLELDPATGLRLTSRKYENSLKNPTLESVAANAVTSDAYLGVHIAGGNGATGEGSYFGKVGDSYYLWLSYGGYAPDGGYNMRQFKADSVEGPYLDAGGQSAIHPTKENILWNGRIGTRAMVGYTYSWWNHSYVAQGHNSMFVDTDGQAYLVYHNKFMDGTVFHEMKVHELVVNEKGVLVVSPFEATKTDEIATGLTAKDIAGEYSTLFMTRDNGKYGSPVTAQSATFNEDDTVSITASKATTGTWKYDEKTGLVTIALSKENTYYGAFLYQNLEGTSLRTLVFTAVGTQQYTLWGYKNNTDKLKPSSDETPSWAVKAGIAEKVKFAKDGSAKELSIPATSVKDTGISLSFYLPKPITGEGADWSSHTVNAGGLIITLPNLDPYWNTVGFAQTNKFPAAGNFSNGGAWNSFLSGKCFITITADSNGVTYYKDGVKIITYKATETFNDGKTTVSSFVTALLDEIEKNGFTALGAVAGTNLVFSSALTDAEATALYNEYKAK